MELYVQNCYPKLWGDNMIYFNKKDIKTNIDELDDKEQLLLIKGICQEIIRDNLDEWVQMINAGKYKTPECDRLWHETFRYMDLLDFCDQKLNN